MPQRDQIYAAADDVLVRVGSVDAVTVDAVSEATGLAGRDILPHVEDWRKRRTAYVALMPAVLEARFRRMAEQWWIMACAEAERIVTAPDRLPAPSQHTRAHLAKVARELTDIAQRLAEELSLPMASPASAVGAAKRSRPARSGGEISGTRAPQPVSSATSKPESNKSVSKGSQPEVKARHKLRRMTEIVKELESDHSRKSQQPLGRQRQTD